MTAAIFYKVAGTQGQFKDSDGLSRDVPCRKSLRKQPLRLQGLLEAERGGFEPPIQTSCILVFETSAFNHSATSP